MKRTKILKVICNYKYLTICDEEKWYSLETEIFDKYLDEPIHISTIIFKQILWRVKHSHYKEKRL
jgi:hypothetical protein